MFARTRYHGRQMRWSRPLAAATLALAVQGCGRGWDLPTFELETASVTIVTRSLPEAVVGMRYRAFIEASGPGPYAWTLRGDGLPAGLALVSTTNVATIEGVPTTAGTFTVTVQVQGGDGTTDRRDLQLVVGSVGGELRITTTDLPVAIVDITYDTTIEATGGGATRTWRISAGELPPGMQLVHDGGDATIVGLPLFPVTSNFEITVSDEAGATDSRAFEIRVIETSGELQILTEFLPDGRVNEAYEARLQGDGGQFPYSWTVSEGSLPPGTSLAVNGSPTTFLTGTPTRPGFYEFTVELFDATGEVAQRDFAVFIQEPQPLEIVTAALPDGRLGLKYLARLEAIGGTLPYAWRVSSGQLPPGLTLGLPNGNGVNLNGRPGVNAGDFTFTIAVEDSSMRVASREFTITIRSGELPLEIVTTGLPTAEVGLAYDEMITAEGGVPPYSWSITGNLPGGMVFDAIGTPSTRVHGTPAQDGSFPVVIEVRDRNGETAARSFTLTVVPSNAPLVILTTSVPNGNPCREYHVEIAAAGGTRVGYDWTIISGSLPTGLSLSSSGTPATTITGVPQTTGNFPVGIRVTDSGGTFVQRAFVIQIVGPPGPRFGLVVGRNTSNRGEIRAVDLCSPTPAASAPLGTTMPGDIGVNVGTNSTAIAPTGNKAAYSAQQSGGVSTVWVVDLDGPMATVAPVLPAFQTGNRQAVVHWSPTGNHLAYRVDALVAGRSDLYVTDVSNPAAPTAPIVVNPTPGASQDVLNAIAWSPDGTKLAFVGDLVTDNVLELFVATIHTSSVSVRAVSGNLSSTQDVLATTPVWGPNSRYLHFGATIRPPRREMYFVDTNAAVPAPAPIASTAASFTTVLGAPVVSPDGNRMVYIADQDQTNSFDMYAVNLGNPNGATRLTMVPPNRRVVGAKFGPQSNRVLFATNTSPTSQGEMFIIDWAGTTMPVRVDAPAPSGGGVSLSQQMYGFNGAGTHVYYLADFTTRFRFQPFWVDVSGATPGMPVSIGQHSGENTRVLHLARDVDQAFIVTQANNNGPPTLFTVDLSGGGPGNSVQLSSPTMLGPVVPFPQLVAPRPAATSVFFAVGTGFSSQGQPHAVRPPAPTMAFPLAPQMNAMFYRMPQ